MKDPQEPRAVQPRDIDRKIADLLDGPPFPTYRERFEYYSTPR